MLHSPYVQPVALALISVPYAIKGALTTDLAASAAALLALLGACAIAALVWSIDHNVRR
jgi:hypothetical protein